ncbi:MAG TPA: hypothetical protein VE953_04045, partial [Terriglobales bacterium]|nr:hypothetical protein [Terriglobales bacterium]
LLIGDAAYTPVIYQRPEADAGELPSGQSRDHEAWRSSLRRLHEARPRHVHFCHHTGVVHG